MAWLIVTFIAAALGALATGHVVLGVYMLITCMPIIAIAAIRHTMQPGPKPTSGGFGMREKIHGTKPFDHAAPTKPANNRYDDPRTDTTMLSGDSLFPD